MDQQGFSYHFLEVVIAPDVNAVEKDLRDRAAPRQLLHPGPQLRMLPHINLEHRDPQSAQGGLGLHAVWTALDGVDGYPAQRTPLALPHLEEASVRTEMTFYQSTFICKMLDHIQRRLKALCTVKGKTNWAPRASKVRQWPGKTHLFKYRNTERHKHMRYIW